MASKTKNIVYQEKVVNKSVNVVSKFYNMGRQDSENGYYYQPHIQEEYEIVYILDGIIDIRINDKKYSLKKDDVYFIQPGQQHEESSQSKFVSFYYIKCNFHQNNGSIAYIADDYNKQIISEENKRIKKTFKHIFEEVQSKKLGYWQVTEAMLVELLCYLLRSQISEDEQEDNKFSSTIIEKPNYGNSIISEVVEVISANEKTFFTVEELAKSVCVSESYLFTLFKKHLNTSPIKFMIALKIDMAKRMIAQTDMTITSIAACYGFQSVTNFIRVFKRINSVTPNEYRKQFKELTK